MNRIHNKIQDIASEINSINSDIDRIDSKTRNNMLTTELIRRRIQDLLMRIRNIKANIERNKQSPFLSTNNPKDLQEFIISFLGGIEIELDDILQEM